MRSRNIRRITDNNLKSCKYCKAETASRNPCKRLASCKIGCKDFCSQHAVALGGTIETHQNIKKCNDPDIQECYRGIKEFPCKKKLTYFWSRNSYKKYLKSRKSQRAGKKRSRKSIIKSYKRRYKSSRQKGTKTKSRSRRIKFSN